MSAGRHSRKKAIREKCIDCCGGLRVEVRKCSAKKCPLWPFRMGNEHRSDSTDEAAQKQGSSRHRKKTGG